RAELQEQAKSYRTNRDEIETLRARPAAVARKGQVADRRRQQLDNKENGLARQQQELQQMYQRQLNLKQLLERSERGCADLKKKNATLTAENGSLRAEIERVR
ncbi:hypothetical protein, partial [Clostridioides difficile]|uniref:hypothetical protein n=1 Tax=Clostridioides difficile TaxID=1496 RepID=UPI000BDAD263